MQRRVRYRLLVPITAALLCSCEKPVAEFEAGEKCDAGDFVVVDDFAGARRGNCKVYADSRVDVEILPESTGEINDSPWYAFKLLPTNPSVAEIAIQYDGGHHRYWPKTSLDGIHWSRLDESALDVNFFESEATLQIKLQDKPIWITAQELVLPSDVEQWVNGITARSDTSHTTLGLSTAGQPIHRLDINPQSRDVVILVGRQHPPEVTGSIAFEGFFEAIVSADDDAKNFRDRFHVVALPMLNPDGVVAGHWRHNSGDTDLNRDWGPFSQTETKLVRDMLDSLDRQSKEIRVFVDFHSTKSNLMYTQSVEDVTKPPGFTEQWIAATSPGLVDYEFTQEPRPVSDSPTGKNYMYKRYGIPAVTFEAADEEDRGAITRAAGLFADELMQLLNELSNGY